MNTNNNVIEKEQAIEKEEKFNDKKFEPVSYDKKEKSHIFRNICISIFVVLIIFIICITIYCLKISSSDKIINGVSIKSVDVSGLTSQEAIEKVRNYINSSVPTEITVKHNDYETTIPISSLSINFNIQDSIDYANTLGKDSNFLTNSFTILNSIFSKKDIEPVLTINKEELTKILEDISSKLPDATIKSGYYIDGNSLVITKGKTGNVIDIDKTITNIENKINDLSFKTEKVELITKEEVPEPISIEQIHNEIYKEPVNAYYTQEPRALFAHENGLDFNISIEEAKKLLEENKDEVVIPLKVLTPDVTTNMIGTEAFPDTLSTFSTRYSARDTARTTNLILAASKINGTVVMPGETFSYNKVVGERTIAAGYKEAPIYVNGRVEDGLGGGICQITTTLYNAVLYANLDIVERSNHQFIPSYSNASRDATVVYGSIDFKFKNNRNYPIKIMCSVSGGIAKFDILGLKSEDDYEVVLSSKITRQTSSYIYSEAYKTLKKNGQVVSTEVLSRDTYKRH